MNRKKILIFFSEGNLPYSPSTINLFDELSKDFDVTIFANSHGNVNLNRKVISFNNSPRILTRLIYVFLKFINDNFVKNITNSLNLTGYNTFRQLKCFLSKNHFSEIIAIDFMGTFMAQLLHKNVHFFSLEISNLKYLENIRLDNLRSVIIQRPDRYDYLFKRKHPHIFFVQNAPTCSGDLKKLQLVDKTKLLVTGYASKGFGIYACLNFLREFDGYQLYIKGALEADFMDNIVIHYSQLQYNNQLVIDIGYIDENEMINYISNFRIGFCFYDFRFSHINNFNYMTAPSGKLFKYFAAGVPVVAINIPGLSYVKEFGAGVLIDDLAPATIKRAIDIIETDYLQYSTNAINASKHFSFDKAVKPLRDFLQAFST